VANDQYEDIDIRDESSDEERKFQFYIKGRRRGAVTMRLDNRVQLHWQTAGPSDIAEARVWIQGLMELHMIAEQLSQEAQGGKRAKVKRARN